MTHEEINKVKEGINNEVTKIIDEKTKGLVSASEMAKQFEAIQQSVKDAGLGHETAIKAEVERLEKAMKEQGTVLENLKQKGNEPQAKSLKSMVFEALQGDGFKAFQNGQTSKMQKVFTNTVGDMTSGGNLSGTYPVILPDRRREPIGILDRPVFLREIMRIGTTTKDKIDFVKESGREGTIAMKSEVAAAGQVDFNLVESTVLVERLPCYLNVSKNMLDDIPYLASFIANSVPNRLMTVEDTQILTGNGSSPNIQGITGVATAFAAGNFANAVADATEADVLRIAISNLNVAYYRATYILMHPEDATKIDLNKDADGNSVRYNYVNRVGGQLIISGVPVLETTAMTAGYYLVGDFNNGCELVDRKLLTMEMTDSHSDYFIKNTTTIRFEERIALPIYRNDSFIYGDFATDIAAILKP